MSLMSSVQCAFVHLLPCSVEVTINGAVLRTPTHLHDVQNDFTCKLEIDIGEETSLVQVSVTVSECNANRKVQASFSKTIMLQCSWK